MNNFSPKNREALQFKMSIYFFNLKDSAGNLAYIFFDIQIAVSLAFEKNLLLERVRCYEDGRFSVMIIRQIEG